MTGPQIALISPRGPLYRHNGGIWKKSLRYAPLTLTTLAALIPDELHAEVTLVDEGIEEVNTDLDADLVGISAITGTAPRAYEIANSFRSRDVPVVLGGVHPTLQPEEAMAHADTVVTGYAEETWPELLYDFTNGSMDRRYDQDPDLDLSGTPRPRRDLLPEDRFTTPHTIEATRGCQHRCDFCAAVAPSAWSGGSLQRPVDEVIDDIREMNPETLVFLDINLMGDTDYAKELFRALIPLDLEWGGLATILAVQDDELIDLAARSGCAGLLVGLESLNPDSLAETRKQFNTLEEYRTVVERLHDVGIGLMGCFVFGFDHDTPAVFEETVDFVNEVGIDLPRYAILTPFPGTPVFRRLVDLDVRWVSQASINAAHDEEFLELLEASGCQGVLVGFETLDPDNLEQMNKQFNTMRGGYEEALANFREHDIRIYGTFILGYDTDTRETIEDAVAFAKKHQLYMAAFNHLTPFPGTPLYERLDDEGRLLYDRWWLDDDYRYNMVPFQPRKMSPEEVQRACVDARAEFYSVPSIARRSMDPVNRGSLFDADDRFMWRNFFFINSMLRHEVEQRDFFPLGDEDYEGDLLTADHSQPFDPTPLAA